jgi:glycosyltransferase involved in cell wall biosynthesis
LSLAATARNAYLRAQWRMADHVFTPSEFSRREILKFIGIPASRVTTTPLALHSQFERPRRSDAERSAVLGRWQIKPPYLLFVGGYETHKNPAALLECLAIIRQSRPDLSLVLAGSGHCPEALPELACRLGVKQNIHFLVNVSDELTDLYDSAALFMSLSWRETFCLPALEAMSRGVPVVASAWGATPEVVGDAGVLVDPRDPRTAASAALKLLQEPLHTQLRRAAMERAKRYSWTVTANRTLEVYQSLLDRAPQRRKAA